MTTIVGAALLGDGLAFVEDAAVVLDEHSIAAAGSRADTSIPSGSTVVSTDGLLIPGFIDAHVHIGFFLPADLVVRGVTTARDLAWPPERIFPLVRRSHTPDFAGPTLVAAGPMLTAPGGYPTRAAWAPSGTGLEVAGPRDAESAVAAVADAGACVVKIALNPEVGPTLDRPTLSAIVAAAHRRGLRVTGHVSGLGELDKALDAGLDELAHMLMSKETIPGEVLERMVEQEVAVVPTLSIRFGRDLDVAVGNLERFLARGGEVVYGTDLGNEGPRPGIDEKEVTQMARAGMTSRDIVRAATTGAARRLGLPGKGALAPGRDADLVAVAPTALDDPRALADVKMTWRGGRRFA